MMSWQYYQAPENIVIFKTNMMSKQEIKKVHQIFTHHGSIDSWWVDLDDIDKVMRIELSEIIPETEIISIMQKIGISCEVLLD